QTLELAGALETRLREAPLREFLDSMFGNEPTLWSDSLVGDDRLRFTLNTLTRIRFVDSDGRLDFAAKDGAGTAPPGLVPWFDAAGRRSAGTPIAFGHWSTLGLLQRGDLLGIDTGCVWGGKLTAVRVDGGRRDVCQVDCEQSQRPG
ncbi:MAG TPA: bis(5'-nucleosyl)-tetraphosphatase (symmetrical), partial [Caldimonas sp.]|nr:bis(5'-nucleosyl)-tetraphosphatase (symmetrical) [Caldimonas sp.]